MRAVLVKELKNRDAVGLGEAPEPSPGAQEILVEVAASSVNFPDILMMDGKYQIRPEPPFVLGKEAAGTVIGLGAGVGEGANGFALGDRVIVEVDYGGFADRLVAPAAAAFKIPEEMDFPTAAAMGLVYQTAWLALFPRAGMQKGDVVLVNGASGGVGMAAVELARAYGATVLAGLTTPSKAAAVKAAGAHHVIDLSRNGLRDSLRQQVHDAVGKRGVDIVVDMLGGTPFEASLRALAFAGRAVVIGFAAGEIPAVRTNYLLLKNIAVMGSTFNGYLEQRPDLVARAHTEILGLWRDGKLKANIMRSYPVEEARQALADVENRKVTGKIVITF
ncbi:MAG: NADPH:quinone oxidoreductase family protein [Kiloniellales bacterium]